MKTQEIVKKYIEQHQLLHPEGRYLVAVSGGADSVCLLLLLQRLGYHVEAVHCNFHLRGDESNRDEDFVKQLCKDNNIILHLTHFYTTEYANIHKVSIEMAARELRYRYFEQLRCDLGYQDVCVAHHSDDNVETVLMNLLRGTGIRGLQGIQPRNGHIVRPLLCISRTDIEAWLAAHQASYITDSTNLKDDILRNHLRLNIIPMLRQMVPAASQNISATIRRMSEALKVYDAATTDALQQLGAHKGVVDIAQLSHEPSPESLLFEWLSPCGFNGITIENISQHLDNPQSGRLWSSDTHDVCIHRGQLLLCLRHSVLPTLRVPEPGTYVYTEKQKYRFSIVDEWAISRHSHTATLDADAVQFPLTIRPVQEGDRFTPYGMKGSKLVSDFLTDRHVSVIEKRRQLVVVDAEDHIVWLVGHRPDAHFCITDDTKKALVIQRC